MSLENSPHCMAALFEAAGAWATVGTEDQTALGSMALNEVNCATQTWSQAKFKLDSGEAYSEIPTSFQGSWMSRGAASAAGAAARAAIVKSYIADRNAYNSDVNWSHKGHSVNEGSEQADLQAMNRMAPLYFQCSQKGNISMLFAVTSALVGGNAPNSIVAVVNPVYLHHEVTGEATIQQLTDHVRQLLKESGSGSDAQAAQQAAQGLLGQAQAWQEGQTACANAGVKQAQGYLTAATNEVVAGLNVVQGLVSMLRLSQRELAG